MTTVNIRERAGEILRLGTTCVGCARAHVLHDQIRTNMGKVSCWFSKIHPAQDV